MKRVLLFLAILLLCGCQSLQRNASTRADTARGQRSAAAADASLEGAFDNHEQVWVAREKAVGTLSPPHIVVIVEATPLADWSIWRIHLDTTVPMDAVWAMQRISAGEGASILLPHRATIATAATGAAFDAKQWTPLDACALRSEPNAHAFSVAADAASCATIAPGLGPQAPLLPLRVEHEGEWLRIRLYADQARGTDVREDARKVQVFAGWAAISGAGANAAADSGDWHMNRTIRLGNEGGRAALTWRDGKPSGYSLGLERLTYRDGNIPVLKLSIIDDSNGRTLAYAWANPEATRIGINLGWVQVGLERATAAPAH